MAISYVDSAVANYTTETSTFSVGVPNTVVAGDLAVVQITTAAATVTTFTPPAGSVELVPPSAQDASFTQGWYLPLSTLPGSISVSLSSARQGTLAVMFLRGVDTDTPLASEVAFSTPTGSPAGDVPAVTAAVDGSYIVGGLYQGSGSASWTPPSGWTIRVDGSRRNGILATRNESVPAGSSGAATWAMDSPNASWQAWQVALRPSAVGPWPSETITYEASGFTSITPASSSWSFTPDTGTLAGDVFVVQVYAQDENATVSGPSGGTRFNTAVTNFAGAGTGDLISVFVWVADSDNPGAQSLTISTSAQGTVTWSRFRGVDATSPIEDFEYSYDNGSMGASQMTVASLSLSEAGCYVLGGFCTDSGGSLPDLDGPPGWTNLFRSITPRKGGMALKGVQSGSGSSGSMTGWGTGGAGAGADRVAPQTAWQIGLRPSSEEEPTLPSLDYAIIGAATSDGFTVHAKVSDTDTARLKVASNSGLTSNVAYSDSVEPDADGFVHMSISGLPARSRDYYAVELTNDDGTVTTSLLGSPKRVLAEDATGSFTVAFGSCWNPGISGTTAFTRILAQDPTLFFHLGDWNYTDSESTSQASHRADMEAQIVADSGLRSLIASVPTTYVKSDHDGDASEQGPGPWTAPNRAATLQMFPYPDRPNSDGLYHSVVVGRARFIFIDTRYLGDHATTRLGSAQLAWLKNEFEQPEPLKFFVMDSAWITDEEAGDPATEDDWATYSDERDEIAAHWVEHGVGTLIGVHGDQHAVSADDGTNNPWGGFPTVCAAPFRNTSSIKTTSNSKWSEGIYPTTEGNNVAQYGLLTVTDTGDDLTVEFGGYDTSDTVRVEMTVNVPLDAASPTITASGLTNPTGRWQGKATRLSWWDGSQWGAVLPTDQGHVIYPDLDDLDVVGPVVDDRQSSRATVAFHDGTLMVLRGHASASRFSSYDATDGYSVIVDDASVPLTSSDLDASPVTLHRSPNGYLWAACMTGGAVQVTRSTDNGATWGTVQTVATIGSASGVVGLASTGSTVVLVATANDGAGRAVRSIPQGSASYASGSWTTETLPALPAGVSSDDHLDVGTLPDGRVLAVSKTTNGDSGTAWLLYGLVRSMSGTWTAHSVVIGGDGTTGYTRPNLALEPGAIRLVYGQYVSPYDLLTRTSTADDLPTWSSAGVLDGTGNRGDSAVAPAAEHIAVAAPGDYPVLAHDRDTGDIDILWITPAEAPVPETSVFLGTVTITAVKLGETDITTFILGG